jgi:hypothetical protein
MKKYVWYFILFILVSIINLTIFTVSYNFLATPYLIEPQKVENASSILMVVFPIYILSSLVSMLISDILTNKLHNK